MSKNRPTLSIKPRGRETPATPQNLFSYPENTLPPGVAALRHKTLEERAQEASQAVWDARLAELKALRRTAGYED